MRVINVLVLAMIYSVQGQGWWFNLFRLPVVKSYVAPAFKWNVAFDSTYVYPGDQALIRLLFTPELANEKLLSPYTTSVTKSSATLSPIPMSIRYVGKTLTCLNVNTVELTTNTDYFITDPMNPRYGFLNPQFVNNSQAAISDYDRLINKFYETRPIDYNNANLVNTRLYTGIGRGYSDLPLDLNTDTVRDIKKKYFDSAGKPNISYLSLRYRKTIELKDAELLRDIQIKYPDVWSTGMFGTKPLLELQQRVQGF